ncbi:MAG: flagellar assembly protein FliX [Janthinobacterium lividum]
MIKIDSFRLQKTATPPRAKKGDSINHFKELSSSPETEGLSQSAPASSLSALTPLNELLQLQNIDESHRGPVRSEENGQKILQELDKLRTSLLIGDLSVSDMRHLSDMMNQNMSPAQDPKLNSIVEEIEQRLAIEITKLEMANL